MEKEITDKDFISGNIWNSESMKSKDEIISADTRQVLYYSVSGKRIPWNSHEVLRKDFLGRLYKKCSKCGRWLRVKEFPSSNNKRSYGGVIAICKNCKLSDTGSKVVEVKQSSNKDCKFIDPEYDTLTKKCMSIVENKIVEPVVKQFKNKIESGDFSNEKVEGSLKLKETYVDLSNSKVENVLELDENKLSLEDRQVMKELEREECIKEFTNEELINELRRRNFKGTLKMEIEL